MLLEVEGAGLQVELDTPDVEDAVRENQVPEETQGVGNQLDNEGCERDGRVSKRQQHVDGGADGAQQQANRPGSYRARGHVEVEVADRGSHLAERREC